MIKKLLALITVLALSLTLVACGTPSPSPSASATPLTVTDHDGNTVTIPEEINRIVITDSYPLPSVLSAFLGSAEKIVGIPPLSMSAAKTGLLGEIFPEILNADTSYMTGADVNIEQLLTLEPDLVFYSAGNADMHDKLANAGIPAIGVSAKNFEYDALKTYEEWIKLLNNVFPNNQNTTTQKVADYGSEMYDLIQSKVGSIAPEDKQDVLFLFQYDETQILTSGKKFFGQYWSEAAGGTNVAEIVAAEASNAVITMEQVYEWDPDVIIITNFTKTQPADIYNNTIGGDDWSTVKAVKNNNVFKMPLGVYRTYTPGVDSPITLLWAAKNIYPELFADIDLNTEMRDYYKEIYNVELTDAQINKVLNPSSAGAEG